jgi:dipeptidyl aminopeptidase/acylaminoacyl peptidase
MKPFHLPLWKKQYSRLILACLGLLLMSCQANPQTLSTVSPFLTAISSVSTATEQPTSTPTISPTLTATPMATTTPTAAPTSTARPSQTPSPTHLPTRSPWRIEDIANFLLYAGDYDIYLLRLDGTNEFITKGHVRLYAGQPWSPDGSHFFFNSGTSSLDPEQFAIANLQTGEVTAIQLTGRPNEVFWSPDGMHLLYVNEATTAPIRLMLYDLATRQNVELLEITVTENSKFLLAGWSSDNETIAFVAEINDQYDLYLLHVVDGTLQQVTNTLEPETLALWSPVSNELLLGTASDTRTFNVPPYRIENLYLVEGSGENLTLLGQFDALSSASWSPDGSQVAYSLDGEFCILTLADQSTVCPLMESLPIDQYSVAFNYPAAWSADGRWLAFQVDTKTGNPCPRIYLLEISTATVRDTGVNTCLTTRIYWSPVLQE